MKFSPALLAVAVVGAAGYAAFTYNQTPASASSTVTSQAPAAAPTAPPIDLGGESDPPLPPNHPPIGNMGAAAPAGHAAHAAGGGANDFAAADQEPASLTWKAPASWPTMPNPSSMRLATNKVPRAAGDTDDAELSISRAGGDTSANIQRWVGQMNATGKEKQQVKTVRGLKVTLVEVDGSYASGGMGGSTQTHEGWALLGAIVETSGQPYFFKMIGPAATVHAARPAFDAMLGSLTPS